MAVIWIGIVLTRWCELEDRDRDWIVADIVERGGAT